MLRAQIVLNNRGVKAMIAGRLRNDWNHSTAAYGRERERERGMEEEDKNLEELTHCEDLPKGILPNADF